MKFRDEKITETIEDFEKLRTSLEDNHVLYAAGENLDRLTVELLKVVELKLLTLALRENGSN